MSARIHIAVLCLLAAVTRAGPYSPAAGQPGSEAVAHDDPALVAWATGWTNYLVGAECLPDWQTPERALGPAGQDTFQIVSLGRGGQITLRFAEPIKDGPGADFAVFENAVTDFFLELAYCEVSSDGVNFVRFPSHSLTPEKLDFYGQVDPSDVDGLAGKYMVGYGAPFDLAELDDPQLDTDNIRFVRLIDIIGDGGSIDDHGNPIYDIYPTYDSAGFDLDAIGVLSNRTQEVSVAALSDFAEWGSSPGEFRISRKSWDLSEALAVNIALSGSAVNGVDYEAQASTVTIPAGSAELTLSLTAIRDGLIEGDERVELELQSGEGYLLGSSTYAAITLRDAPYASWRIAHFGADADAPLAQDAADWDGDGRNNLIEYALGSDPKTPDARTLRIGLAASDGEPRVELSCAGEAPPVDVELRLLKAGGLSESAGWIDVGSPLPDGSGELRLLLPDDSSAMGSSFFKLDAELR